MIQKSTYFKLDQFSLLNKKLIFQILKDGVDYL